MRISDAHSSLVAVYNDWSFLLGNPQFIQNGNAITWPNSNGMRLKYPVMASDVLDLSDARQYTFQIIEDGSLIQIYYLYAPDRRTILSASLGFYRSISDFTVQKRPDDLHGVTFEQPAPVDGDFVEDIFLNISSVENASNNPGDAPVGWLRFDYKPADARGILHHDCHLHISGFPDARFVVAGLPTPRQFIELVVASFYPHQYKKHRLDETWEYRDPSPIKAVNTECFPLTECAAYQHMIHFRVPAIRATFSK